MQKIREDSERTWYLVKEWVTKSGLKARICKCEWHTRVTSIASHLHDFHTGYVQVPSDKKVDSEKIDVHGGVTFEKGSLPDAEGEWVGFDMAHYDDENIPDAENYAIAECEKLAAQLV
jgi:hypothetical protein